MEPELWGCLYWGRFGSDDARRLVCALDAELHPDVPPHVGIADLRRFEGADAQAFELLATYLASRADELRARVRRQAVIRPESGIAAAVVAGFYEVRPPPYPARVFADLHEALRWLDVHDHLPALVELDRLHAQIAGVSPAVRALRDCLAACLQTASIDATARALGMSTRTLQRQLRDAGTSFKRELVGARVRAAQAMLLDDDAKLAAIASEAGFASPQHLSVTFRTATGETPSEWRARRRGRQRIP